MALTNDQKQRLAAALIGAAADMIECWSERAATYDAEDIPRDEAAQQIARWLTRLPGSAWDTRLPHHPW